MMDAVESIFELVAGQPSTDKDGQNEFRGFVHVYKLRKELLL